MKFCFLKNTLSFEYLSISDFHISFSFGGYGVIVVVVMSAGRGE
jgi:hypothetical protein